MTRLLRVMELVTSEEEVSLISEQGLSVVYRPHRQVDLIACLKSIY
jgi:hypothetical protein